MARGQKAGELVDLLGREGVAEGWHVQATSQHLAFELRNSKAAAHITEIRPLASASAGDAVAMGTAFLLKESGPGNLSGLRGSGRR